MALPKIMKTVALKAAAVTLAAETVIGGEIDVRNYNTMVVYVNYVNGDETSVDIIPKVLHAPSGNEYPFMEWSEAAVFLRTAKIFRLTATGKAYIVLDVRGINIIKLYEDATGGTPTGTTAVDYTVISE